MELSIYQWLSKIEDLDIRRLAKRNRKEARKSIKIIERYPSLSAALMGAFIWQKTPEGHKYWAKFHHSQIWKEQ